MWIFFFWAILAAAACLVALSLVSIPVAALYARFVYAERCRAMAALAHDSDSNAIVEHCNAEIRRAIDEGNPGFPWPPSVFRFERDVEAWSKVREWAQQQRNEVRA